ncbi:MAG: glycerate kinase [Fimbriimonadaceae bacterium]|nr:glycerate kinase [Fimbriimonadaceae bacterium]
MRILVAPDSFKDCLPAAAVAAALAAGCRRVVPDATVVELPLADGGQGTTAALVAALGGEWRTATVSDPLGRPISARFGWLPAERLAILEMASASGLERLAATERDARVTSTAGTGELLRAALELGARQILLGIGGSATNDGGAGFATALGARLLDGRGAELPPGGAALAGLAQIDTRGLDPRLTQVALQVACDVDNPLCGPRGASAVYGPQKGADSAAVAVLDAALAHYGCLLARDLGRAVAEQPGAGAAGGLGAGLLAFTSARLSPGIELVLQAVRFDQQLADADLVISGEGRLDAQTLHGKTLAGVLRHAQPAGVPVVAVAGAVSGDLAALRAAGLAGAVALPRGPLDLATALAQAPELLAVAAETVLGIFLAGRQRSS